VRTIRVGRCDRLDRNRSHYGHDRRTLSRRAGGRRRASARRQGLRLHAYRRIAQLRELACAPVVVAIGESGLDFHYVHSPAAAQEKSLRRHLELAAEMEKPIVIHCRDGEQRLVEIVREIGIPPRGGVIHCFTGDEAAAREFLAARVFTSRSRES